MQLFVNFFITKINLLANPPSNLNIKNKNLKHI